MSRFHSYINTSIQLLTDYSGKQPFQFHLKTYFGANKKYGSKDRKQIASICYQWFRVSHVFDGTMSPDHLAKAVFLCSPANNAILADIAPELNERAAYPIVKKMESLGKSNDKIFPFS